MNQSIKVNPRATIAVDFNEFSDRNLIRALASDAGPDPDAIEPGDLAILLDEEGNIAFGSIEGRKDLIIFVRVDWDTFVRGDDRTLDIKMLDATNVRILETNSFGKSSTDFIYTRRVTADWARDRSLRQFDLAALTAGDRR